MMNKQRILYIPENELPSRKGGFSLGKIMYLKPGYNNVNFADWQEASTNKYVKQRINWGAIKVIGKPVEEAKANSLLDLSADEAIKIVSDTSEVNLLKEYLAAEENKKGKNRTTVINALNKQIKSIEEGSL